MSNGVSTVFQPIRASTVSVKQDPYIEYRKMTATVKENPQAVSQYSDVLSKVLDPYAETNGELVITANGSESYFAMKGTPFTNFGAILLNVIHIHFIDRTQFDLDLHIWGKNLPPRATRIEAKKLRSRTWIDDLGPQYLCERGIGNLAVLIQAMAQYAPVRHEYNYSGWEINNENFYIRDGCKLCEEDWDEAKAKAPAHHTIKMLDVAPHGVTIPLLAIALLSLVHSRMVAQGTFFKGVCCLEAPTQSFKSTIASLFLDFAHGREADTNFEATMAAIVRTVGNKRDSTVIVDDLKPGATKFETNEMLRKLSTLIRMASDDSGGIQKAGSQNTTISNVAQGLVVVTAEHIHLQVQSTLARLLVLEMNRKSVDIGKLTYFQEYHRIYREFIVDYIQYIATQGIEQYCANLVQRFLRERNTLRNVLLAKGILVDNRTSDMCTWLWIAFGEFLVYAQKVEAVTSEQFEYWDSEARIVFLSLMERQADRVAELNPIKQFFRGLQVLLDTKEVKLGELQARNSGYAVADSKAAIGFAKSGFVYLKNGVALQAVVAYYHRTGKDFAINESALRKALADGGYLILGDKKSPIWRLSVNHESYQCIKFDKTKFYQLLQGGKENGQNYEKELPGDRAMRRNADDFLGPGK